MPSHAPLKNNKHLNIPFQSTQPRRGKNKSELQGLTPSSWVRPCGMRGGGWGHASILSVMPNVASDKLEVWIFMYTILILILETKLKKKKKKNSGNEISTAMCWNQPSVSAGFCFWLRVGSAVGTERNLIHVG